MRVAPLLLLTVLVWGALGGADRAAADHSGTLQLNDRVGPYVLMTWTEPRQPRTDSCRVTTTVLRPKILRPVADVAVRLTARRADGVRTVVSATASRDRHPARINHVADLALPSPGRWAVTVHVSGPDGAGSAEFPLDVAASSWGAWPWLAGGVPVLGLAVTWWRRRRRASRVRRLAGGASLLLIALAPPTALAVHGSPPAPLGLVSAADLKAQLDHGQPPALIDLRPADLFRVGHLPGARSIPLRELRRRYREIPRGRVVLYCDCERDDLEAAYRLLVDRGAEDVRALEEGFAGWRRRGYPIAR